MDIDKHFKRASLLSNTVYGILPNEVPKKRPSELEAPPDKYYLAFLFSFFSGMVGIIPITFFLTANDYWMYKLRDVSYDTYDLNNKTFLQKMFASMNSIGNSIPSVLSTILTIKYAPRFQLRTRFLFTLGIISCMFIIFTSLVRINTDSWQILFFVIVLIVLAMIAGVQPLFIMSNLAFISRLPPKYLSINMYGVAVGGLFGSALQVITLSISKDSIQSALIYFSCGTVIVCFTLGLALLLKYSPMVNYYLSNVKTEETTDYTVKELLHTSKKMWPILLNILIPCLTSGAEHPNLTSLVVSENYDPNGNNLWYNKYFVVVITFFGYDFFQIVGRFFSGAFVTKKRKFRFIIITVLRSTLLVPLYLFCNARPRSHLPVWFPHDYQYMIIHFLSSTTSSALLTTQFLSVSNLEEDNPELAFMVMGAFMNLVMTLISPLNPVFVTLL